MEELLVWLSYKSEIYRYKPRKEDSVFDVVESSWLRMIHMQISNGGVVYYNQLVQTSSSWQDASLWR
jgi:hypothetical protein